MGKSIIKEFQKAIVLHTIDESWKEHLREMDELRNSVQNASYENKDPLLIYKLESYELFRKMVEAMNRKTVAILMRARIPVPEAPSEEEMERQRQIEIRRAAEQRADMSKYRTQKDDIEAQQQAQREAANRPQGPAPQAPIRNDNKIGRNDPCPCGSGKKFKQCHGRNL